MQRLTLSHSHTNLIKHKIRTHNIEAKYLYGFKKDKTMYYEKKKTKAETKNKPPKRYLSSFWFAHTLDMVHVTP